MQIKAYRKPHAFNNKKKNIKKENFEHFSLTIVRLENQKFVGMIEISRYVICTKLYFIFITGFENDRLCTCSCRYLIYWGH